MIRSVLAAVVSVTLFITAAAAQENLMPHNEKNWKRLQSFRVWNIIQALDLDATSEQGLAVLAVINKYAEREREFVLERTRLFLALRAELQTKEPDEKN